MKINNREIIIGIVIGFLVSSTFGIVATTVIPSESVSYSNSKTNETTVEGSLNELFSAVDINNKIGNTDISNIDDGTITGSINSLNNQLNGNMQNINLKEQDLSLVESVSLSSSDFFAYKKIGKMVNINFSFSFSQENSNYNIGYLPENIRPAYFQIIPVFVNSSTESSGKMARMVIYENGLIQIQDFSGFFFIVQSEVVQGTWTYMTN